MSSRLWCHFIWMELAWHLIFNSIVADLQLLFFPRQICVFASHMESLVCWRGCNISMTTQHLWRNTEHVITLFITCLLHSAGCVMKTVLMCTWYYFGNHCSYKPTIHVITTMLYDIDIVNGQDTLYFYFFKSVLRLGSWTCHLNKAPAELLCPKQILVFWTFFFKRRHSECLQVALFFCCANTIYLLTLFTKLFRKLWAAPPFNISQSNLKSNVLPRSCQHAVPS